MNKETFKQTYLPLSASMYRTAYRILGNPEDAEDMVQEAYMKLWKQRDTLDGILDARAYAVTSVKNLCLDTIRKRHLSYENYEKTERTIAAASTPYSETIHSEEAALLHRYIDSLEEPQHTVIVMRDIGGYSFEEIAAAVQLKEAHIRTHFLSHTEESHADATLFRILAEESQALPPDGMEQRLEAWIDRQSVVPSRKRRFLFWRPVAVAAALLCYVGITHVLQQHNGLTPQETLIAKKALGSTLKCIETGEQSVLRTHERLKYIKRDIHKNIHELKDIAL